MPGTQRPQEVRRVSIEGLKARFEEIKKGGLNDLTLRIRRSLSWLERAERENPGDLDAAFVFYWIAFNAAYGEDRADGTEEAERQRFGRYLERIVVLDRERSIYDGLWEAYTGSVRILLENKFVYRPFWKHHNGAPGYERWEQWFAIEKQRVRQALGREDTLAVLTTVFDRLYVLRNQLVHGGATWNGSVNRNQVRDGASIMAFLMPKFIGVMLDAPTEEWGPAYYPVVSD